MNPELPPNVRVELEARLTAYLLGELPAHEAAAFRQALDEDAELAKLCDRLKPTIKFVRETAVPAQSATPKPAEPLRLSEERRQKLLAHFKTIAPREFAPPQKKFPWPIAIAACAALLLAAVPLFLPALAKSKFKAGNVAILSNLRQLDGAKQEWALANKKSPNDTPTLKDIMPYMGRGNGEAPAPVAGEKYIIGRVGESPAVELSASKAKKIFGVTAAGKGNELVLVEADGQLAAKNPQGSYTLSRLAKAPALNLSLGDATHGYNENHGDNEKEIPPVATPAPAPHTIIVLPATEELAATTPVPAQDGDAHPGFKEEPAISADRSGGIAGNLTDSFQTSQAAQNVPQAGTDVPLQATPPPPVAVAQPPVSTGFSFGAGGGGGGAAPGSLPAQSQNFFNGGQITTTPPAAGNAISTGDILTVLGRRSYDTTFAVTNGIIAGNPVGQFPAQSANTAIVLPSEAGGSNVESLEVVGYVNIKLSTNTAIVLPSSTLNADSTVQQPFTTVANGTLGGAGQWNLETGNSQTPGFTAGPTPIVMDDSGVQSANRKLGVNGSQPRETVTLLPQGNGLPLSAVATASGNPLLARQTTLLKQQNGTINSFADSSIPSPTPPAATPLPAGGTVIAGSSMSLADGSIDKQPQIFYRTTAAEEPQRQIKDENGKSVQKADVNAAYAAKQQELAMLTKERETLALKTFQEGVETKEPPKVSNTVASSYGRFRDKQMIAGGASENPQSQLAEDDLKIARDKEELAMLRKKSETLTAAENAVVQNASENLDQAPAKPAAPIPTPQPEMLTRENAFSTFSLNVADVSFKLAAASLEKGLMPDPASIRSEEFINAFDYRDPDPAPGAPLGFAWERAYYPFAHNRDLLRFSVKTAAAGRPPGRALNIVLLLDNSGSMERADRVQIIHEALRVLASQLQPQDIISIVTFARTPRLWVDGVSGAQAGEVVEKVSVLTPQGGTNLEEAMKLAYETALRHYLANGVNRVVLLTDGAANLGNVDPVALKQKVEDNRKQGIALDCFGIGWEGYNDDLLETLSRNGDGRYGFLNTPEEAASDFAGQLAGALNIAAADVKVQVEFNPQRVTAYRQIGYAKHQLTKEQFRDNTVDAAEIGAAESGNALYAIEVNAGGEGPLATVRVRFKVPGTSDYQEHAWEVPFTGNATPLEQASPAMRLAATASAFSEWLGTSPYAAEVTPDQLLRYIAGVPQAYGADTRPAKLEWMIRQAKSISGK